MARKFVNDKEVTKTLKVLDFERGIAIIDGDSTKKERKIHANTFGRMFIVDEDRKHILITEWDLEQHGLIDDELEMTGFETTYEKFARMIGF